MAKRRARSKEENVQQEAEDASEESEEEEFDVSTSDDDSVELDDFSDDGNEEDQDGEGKDNVDVDFDFYDPKPADFHGIKTLLQNYLDTQPFDISQMVDGIIEQTTVGTIVRTSEDEAPVGVVSVINMHLKRAESYVKQIVAHLLGKCPNKAAKAKLEETLKCQKLGLIVSERLVNCPPQLSKPLMSGLFDEIQWATEDEPTEEKRQSFVFEKYLMFTRVCRDSAPVAHSSGAGSSSAGGPAKKKKKHAADAEGEQLVFIRPEDEVFHQLCAWSFTYHLDQKFSEDAELKPMRMVMLVEASSISKARKLLDRHVACQMPEPPLKQKI